MRASTRRSRKSSQNGWGDDRRTSRKDGHGAVKTHEGEDPEGSTGEDRLVRTLQAGDPEGFEELVRCYGPRLLAVARRILRDEEDARDCVQETFLSAHRTIGTFEPYSRLGAWLHRIVTNAALMKLRARRAHPDEPIEGLLPTYDEHGFRVGPIRSNDLSPERLLQRTSTSRLVRDAIDGLPESYRTILVLRDLEGFSVQETAKLLGITEGAVKVRTHRARLALKVPLQPLFEEDL